MNLLTATGRLAAAVPDAGTFAVSYPSNASPDFGAVDEGAFFGAMGHKFVLGQGELEFPTQFDLTFTTSTITVTNKSGSTWAAGTDWTLQLNQQGKRIFRTESATGTGRTINRAARSDSVLMNLGAPDTADADGISASQSVLAAAAALLNGAVGATLDVPRNVVGAWTGAAVVTVVGYDEYGEVVKESSASGTTFTGKKAFKKITSIKPDANITLATFGTGDVLGLPVFLPSAGHVVKELQDGVAATAGTFVAGIRVAGGSTATSGDVRGTYDPNAACDGDKVFQIIASLPDPQFTGIDQYAA
jgi:hypothetical protein